MLSVAAFRELYCRTSNPARPYMLWLSEVREARRLFRAFKARMAELVQEVISPYCHIRCVACEAGGRCGRHTYMPVEQVWIFTM